MARYGRGLICLSMDGRPPRRARSPAGGDRQFAPLRARPSASRSTPSSTSRPAFLRPTGRRRFSTAIDPKTRAVGPCAPRPRLSVARPGRRCARPHRPDRSGSRSARIAGLYPAGVICEIMNEDGTMARVPELARFARKHKLLMITIADLIKYRMRTETLVHRVASAQAADGVRRVPRGRLRERHRRRDARRAGQRGRSATARTSSCACTRAA